MICGTRDPNESGTSKMRYYRSFPWPWKCWNKRSRWFGLAGRWEVCVSVCAHLRGRLGAYVPRHTFPLSARKIESAGRVSMPRLKSSGAISSHSSPLHLPQVALSSCQSTACLLSSPIIMNMDVSVEPSVLMGGTGKNNQVPY